MRIRVQKWGNSLAVRIPKSFALETALDHNSEVDLALDHGRLVITPVISPEFSLEELLDGVNASNLHAETDTGPSVGRETW